MQKYDPNGSIDDISKIMSVNYASGTVLPTTTIKDKPKFVHRCSSFCRLPFLHKMLNPHRRMHQRDTNCIPKGCRPNIRRMKKLRLVESHFDSAKEAEVALRSYRREKRLRKIFFRHSVLGVAADKLKEQTGQIQHIGAPMEMNWMNSHSGPLFKHQPRSNIAPIPTVQVTGLEDALEAFKMSGTMKNSVIVAAEEFYDKDEICYTC